MSKIRNFSLGKIPLRSLSHVLLNLFNIIWDHLKLTETASEGITDDVLINIRNFGPANFTKKPLAQPKMLNLVNRIWVHLKFAQGGVLVCSGKSDLAKKLFFGEIKTTRSLRSESSRLVRAQIWVIRAYCYSNLGLIGATWVIQGSYKGHLVSALLRPRSSALIRAHWKWKVIMAHLGQAVG